MLPNDSVNLTLGTGNLTDRIVAEPDSSLVIFTFSKRVVEGKSWSTVIQRNLYRKSTFHIREVEALNWHLPVPKGSSETDTCIC